MKIGFDYWNVLSHYPVHFVNLASMYIDYGNEVYVISAVGKNRAGTVKADVDRICRDLFEVHEVIFSHPSQSPVLKTAKALELGIKVFYDDRQDVCDSMNEAGILCFKVPRLDYMSDTQAERV